MFKKILLRKKTLIPPEEIRLEIEKIIREAVSYMISCLNESAACMDNNALEAKKVYDDTKGKLLLSQKTITKINDIWPQGINIVRTYQEIIGLDLKMLENDYECGNYLRSAPHPMDSNYITKNREFYIRRHEIAEMADKKLFQIRDVIISSIGFDINEILQENP